ncbi:MAG: MCP four helix bundle domain-containing protein [Flavobacteriales bacterium]
MGFNRIKWVLGILVVFGIVIATNLIDRKNFKQMKDSVETIYADRLVAKDLIFQISNAVHDKELALANMDSTFFLNNSSKVNAELSEMVAHYEETTLTPDELKSFELLKGDIRSMTQAEKAFTSGNFENKKPLKAELVGAKTHLSDLAQIQLEEGNRELAKGKRALETVELFTQIEIYLLIFLGIIVQVIVLYRPNKEK